MEVAKLVIGTGRYKTVLKAPTVEEAATRIRRRQIFQKAINKDTTDFSAIIKYASEKPKADGIKKFWDGSKELPIQFKFGGLKEDMEAAIATMRAKAEAKGVTFIVTKERNPAPAEGIYTTHIDNYLELLRKEKPLVHNIGKGFDVQG